MDTRLLTLSEVKERTSILTNGKYRYIDNIYINSRTKSKFSCDRGHIFKMTWNNFQRGNRCPDCHGSKKKTIEEIKDFTKRKGFQCISKSYTNCQAISLQFKCPNGHIFTTSWNSFRNHQGCLKCAGLEKKSLEHIKEYVNEFGYQCVSDKYINSITKLIFLCDKNHTFKMTWSNIRQSHRCPECKKMKMSGENHRLWRNYSDEELKNWWKYKKAVIRATNKNYEKYQHILNPDSLPRGVHTFHVDHKFSILDGYTNNIPIEVISSPVNCQLLPAHENRSKNGRSIISLDTLFNLYNQFKGENSDEDVTSS